MRIRRTKSTPAPIDRDEFDDVSMTEQLLTQLREIADGAEKDLRDAVGRACPEHRPIQHRDRKPAWCSRCGRGERGTMQHPPTTEGEI